MFKAKTLRKVKGVTSIFLNGGGGSPLSNDLVPFRTRRPSEAISAQLIPNQAALMAPALGLHAPFFHFPDPEKNKISPLYREWLRGARAVRMEKIPSPQVVAVNRGDVREDFYA
ncbi:hypothetical protein NPIL_662121 [Nephila pilipes]|uniref:Uncharacterized protein n=1 Tax=Nephila pilipes TaxID=299642 RepID=A0A8X6IPT4_NEPPI|nr:hypothetical protein NPIL_662121 [Nephila pilipes]